MATVYSGSRWNGESKRTGWRIRVDYSGTSASVYVDVVSDYTSSSIWLRFSTGTNTFTKSANTYYSSNNGKSANLLGTLTIDPYTTTTVYETCSGSSWGGNVNGESSVTIPRQYTPSAPTISASVSGITTNSATYTAQMTNNPYSYWRVHIYDTGGNWKTYSTAVNTPCSFTQTGLAHNTSYNFYYQYTNSSDGEGSGLIATKFTTLGNAPTINSVSPSPSRTTCSLANNSISYDTNASFSSVSVRYGTTTSYGSTASSTSLSGLQPNTTYYYSMTITDNWGRTSGAKTGSFVTTGNAPTASHNTSGDHIGRTYAQIGFAYTCDTNASYSGSTFNYGTTTSYGSTGTADAYNHFFAGGTSESGGTLTPNTTYYYSFTIKDTFNRTSSAVTGSFKTTCNAPSSLNITTGTITQTTIPVSVSAIGDTNAPITNYTVECYNNAETTLVKSVSLGTSTTGSINDLTPNTVYKIRLKATNAGGTTTGSFISATTLADQAKIPVKISNTWKIADAFVKINGTWRKVEKAYIKVNNTWKENI